MYKKPSSPLYANVSEKNYKREELTAQDDTPGYYNATTKKLPQSSQGVYSNLSYQPKSNNHYSNVAEANKPPFTHPQYPLYDNLKSSGSLFNF